MNEKYTKYSSKYYIRREIEIIMEKLYFISTDFDIYKKLKMGENKEYICDSFPIIFSHMLDALFLKVLIEFTKLFDSYNQNSISIPSIIQKYNDYRELYKEKEYFYIKERNTNKRIRFNIDSKKIDDCINKLNNDLNKNNKITQYLSKRRNKSIAHNDKAFGFNRNKKFYKDEITYEELENFISIIYIDVNKIYLSLFGSQYSYQDEYTSEIICLKEMLKNKKHN